MAESGEMPFVCANVLTEERCSLMQFKLVNPAPHGHSSMLEKCNIFFLVGAVMQEEGRL